MLSPFFVSVAGWRQSLRLNNKLGANVLLRCLEGTLLIALPWQICLA